MTSRNRRRRMTKIRKAINADTAMPPTTPPAITPVDIAGDCWVLDCEDKLSPASPLEPLSCGSPASFVSPALPWKTEVAWPEEDDVTEFEPTGPDTEPEVDPGLDGFVLVGE